MMNLYKIIFIDKEGFPAFNYGTCDSFVVRANTEEEAINECITENEDNLPIYETIGCIKIGISNADEYKTEIILESYNAG